MIDIKKSIQKLSENDISDMSLLYKDAFLNHLNHEQRVAATRKEGNYLVIAGPGSGKTHTLAYRVAYLVKQHIDPKAIVVITFTRKAGNVLKERIQRLLPETQIGFIGTFHAFSNHISKMLGSSSPMSGFRLLDQEDDAQVHKLVLADFENFKKPIKAKQLQKMISYCENTQMSVKDYIEANDLQRLKPDIENLERYRVCYQHYKTQHRLASYDDMIQLVSKYLQKNGSKKISKQFSYLMVDEYQDTNQMQLDFIKKLTIENTMAIGDDFQGIYAFRGADHKIILNFYNDFEGASMIKLKDNYRSTKEIVNYVNKTIERSNMGYKKTFRVTKKDTGTAEVISGLNLEAHKKIILDRIQAAPNSRHALIYRFNKYRVPFEKALIEAQIDYSVYGGIRLLERRHIKDILAFLMVYLNRLDVVSMNRILTILPGIGPKTAKRLIDSSLQDLSIVPMKSRQHVEKIKMIIETEQSKEVLYDEVCQLYFELYEYVSSEYYTKEEVQEDFKLVKELLENYESLDNFIIQLILEPVMDMHQGEQPKVVLTTIHSAKGLEFDYVYFFHTHSWYNNYDVERLEEDRRLFYVGISRAKQHLLIFDHSQYRRSFDEILMDFDNLSVANETYYSSEPEQYDEKMFEWINEKAYDRTEPTDSHQNCLTAVAGELRMALKRQKEKVFLGPMKISLNESIVQPDAFVMPGHDVRDGCPILIVEVMTEATEDRDLKVKLNLYLESGVKEYWIVDTIKEELIVYHFDEFLVSGLKTYQKNEYVKSPHLITVDILVEDLFE